MCCWQDRRFHMTSMYYSTKQRQLCVAFPLLSEPVHRDCMHDDGYDQLP